MNSQDKTNLQEELVEMEKYFLKRISIYKSGFEEEKMVLEKELEDTKISQLNALLKLKQMKDKVEELESKNKFYKKRLAIYEKDKPES